MLLFLKISKPLGLASRKVAPKRKADDSDAPALQGNSNDESGQAVEPLVTDAKMRKLAEVIYMLKFFAEMLRLAFLNLYYNYL